MGRVEIEEKLEFEVGFNLFINGPSCQVYIANLRKTGQQGNGVSYAESRIYPTSIGI